MDENVITFIDEAPQLPTLREEELSKIEQLYNKCVIKIDEETVPPRPLLSIDGVGFCRRGNLTYIAAAAKNGKTHAMDCLLAAMVSGQLWRLKAEEVVKRIILGETEMSRDDVHKRLERIAYLAGMSPAEVMEVVTILSMRELTPQERIDVIDFAVEKIHPDAVLIDGQNDLNPCINEVKDAERVIGWLMAMSSKYNCCIVAVQHKNPDGGRMSGFNGTFSMAKASEVFDVQKRPGGLFEVSCNIARHTEPPRWSFRFDADGNLQSGDVDLEKSREQAEREAKDKEMRELSRFNIPETVADYLTANGGVARMADLVKELVNKVTVDGKPIDRTTARRRVEKLKTLEFLSESNNTFSLSSKVDLTIVEESEPSIFLPGMKQE